MALKVIPCGIDYPHQYRIEGSAPGDTFDDIYVNFSGYFGSYGPHVFNAAPDLLEHLISARDWIDELADQIGAGARVNGVLGRIDDAIAKARGEQEENND